MIRRSLNLLVNEGVSELRVISDNGISSGYFDDLEQMAKTAEIVDKYPETNGVYIVLNSINPDLLARRSNRLKTRLSKKDATTADQDIIKRKWFPVDIDPIRPSGVSSSEEEHEAALKKAKEIMLFLHENGFHIPVCADSGNGAHLLYRIDLPNDEDSRNLIKKCLENLSKIYSDEKSGVDTSVFNAARIWKLYGTTSKKGDNTEARPHRISAILTEGEDLTLSVDHLKWLANLIPEPEAAHTKDRFNPKERENDKAIDISSWLSKHGLGYEQKPYSDGELFVLNECPFSSAHKDGAYVIQFKSGAIFAGCHHNSCGSGSQRWNELRWMYERKTFDERYHYFKKRGDKARAQARAESNIVVQDIIKIEPSLKEEVKEVLTSDPIAYMLNSFAKDHEGDQIVAECMIMSLASRNVINSKGLHVSITGESGKGKSHACSTMLKQVPEQTKMDDRMSDKALFYMEDTLPGTVLVLDDMALSEQMSEVLKGVTSSFQKPFGYRTVSKDRKGMRCVIPERCVWWVAKVEGAGDDQVFNRMLNVWIDDTIDQDERVLQRALRDCSQLPNLIEEKESKENLISQQIWNCLKSAYVVIPYGERIKFSNASNRRNPDMLIDLIRSHAILKQYNRKQEEVNDTLVVYAENEDFNAARSLYDRLNCESGGQGSKLTRKESELMRSMKKAGQVEISIQQLQKITGWSNSAIYKLLHGYNSRGVTYSGLLEKCPAVAYCDRSITLGNGDSQTTRKVKVYTFDEKLYNEWNHSGSVWLEEEKGDSGNQNNDQKTSRGCLCNILQNADQIRNEKDNIKSVSEENKENNNNKNIDSGENENSRQNFHKPDLVYDCNTLQQTTIRNDDQTDYTTQNSDQIENCSSRKNENDPHCSKLVPITEIISIDFQPKLGNHPSPCCVCGASDTKFNEMLTERRRKTKDDPRQLCYTCYKTIRKRESETILSKPGILQLDQMKKLSHSLGICHVCNENDFSWYNYDIKIGICDQCYSKFKNEGEL